LPGRLGRFMGGRGELAEGKKKGGRLILRASLELRCGRSDDGQG
jgi:hypothetical protein